MYWQINRYEEKYAPARDVDKGCLLIPGWSMDSQVFEWLLPGLAQHFMVSCADVLCYPEPDQEQAFMAELAAAIEKPVWVIGWSLGGNIALDLAHRYPDRVAGLCLLSVTPKFVADESWPVGMPAETFAKFAGGLSTDIDKLLRRFDLLQVRGDERERQLHQALSEYRRQQQVIPDVQLQRGLQLLASYDQRKLLQDIRQPMLWCYGEVDNVVNVYTAEEVRRLVPAANIEVFRLVAHIPFLSRPEHFFRALVDLLDKKRIEQQKRKIASAFSQAAAAYDDAAMLQKWVAGELFEKVEKTDGLLLDAGCGTGYWTARLASKAAVVAGLDMAAGMLQFGKAHNAVVAGWIEGDLESLPVADCCISTIFSSLAVQWCHDFSQVLDEWHRVLKPGGRAYIATLGCDTLHELRDSWCKVDEGRHVNRFLSHAELTELIDRSPFDMAMLQVEKRVVRFRELPDLLHDMKRIGAQTLIAGREKGLMGKQRFSRLHAAYEQYRDSDGMLPATYEVIFLCLEKHR